MGVRGFGSFVKYAMFLFNAVIMVAGCALLGFGIYIRTNSSSVARFSSVLGSNLLPTISLVLIVVGAIIMFLSFLGCCGAIKEVKCMLTMFFIFLLLIFIAVLAGGILFYALRSKIEDTTLEQLRYQLVSKYGQKGEESVTEGWDYMQNIFKCCGVIGGINSTESWSYYKTSSNWYKNLNQTGVFVPKSCCKDTTNTPNFNKCQGISYKDIIPAKGPPVTEALMNDQLFTQGCYTAVQAGIKDNVSIFIGIGAGLLFLMVLGMVFSMCLCKRINNEDYDCDD